MKSTSTEVTYHILTHNVKHTSKALVFFKKFQKLGTKNLDQIVILPLYPYSNHISAKIISPPPLKLYLEIQMMKIKPETKRSNNLEQTYFTYKNQTKKYESSHPIKFLLKRITKLAFLRWKLDLPITLNKLVVGEY